MLIKFLLLTIILNFCYAYKILVMFPIPGKSHSILGNGYVRNLLEAGHEVTYITPFPEQNAPANLRYINISETIKFLDMGIFDIKVIMSKEVDFQDQLVIMTVIDDFWKHIFQTEVMQNFMNDPNEKFDVVVVEWLYSEMGSGLSTVFNCPFIWSSSMDPHTFVMSLINEHLNPSYTFHHLSMEYSSSFRERVNQLWSVSRLWYHEWRNSDKDNEKFKQLYGPIVAKKGRELPHFDDVKYNASLMLGNSHVITGDGFALPQNYKHIGGYYFEDAVPPLPKDLKEIMDNAKDGVIYFSMGSNLKSSNIPEPIKKNLIEMLSKLKQTIIWKLENVIPNLPKNIHILPWAPQRSILAHPNCVLFITHGGLLSIFETLHAGKPIIGIPFFADQFLNTNRGIAKGFAKRIDFDENAPENLRIAIKEMLENQSYRQRAEELSKVFKHRIIHPGKELVYWIEHVIKSNGAPHMRSAALHISWYKKLYLDLLLVIMIALISIILIFKYLLSLIRVEIRQKSKLL